MKKTKRLDYHSSLNKFNLLFYWFLSIFVILMLILILFSYNIFDKVKENGQVLVRQSSSNSLKNINNDLLEKVYDINKNSTNVMDIKKEEKHLINNEKESTNISDYIHNSIEKLSEIVYNYVLEEKRSQSIIEENYIESIEEYLSNIINIKDIHINDYYVVKDDKVCYYNNAINSFVFYDYDNDLKDIKELYDYYFVNKTDYSLKEKNFETDKLIYLKELNKFYLINFKFSFIERQEVKDKILLEIMKSNIEITEVIPKELYNKDILSKIIGDDKFLVTKKYNIDNFNKEKLLNANMYLYENSLYIDIIELSDEKDKILELLECYDSYLIEKLYIVIETLYNL